MLIITTIILALGLMITGYVFRRPAVAMVSSVVWLVMGIFSRSLSAELWDIYYLLFIVGVCLFFVAFVEGIILRPKIEDTEIEEDIWDREIEEYIARRTKWKDRMSRVMDVSGGERNRLSGPPDRLLLK